MVIVFFATKNPHKIREVESIKPHWIELEKLPDSIPDAPEYGDTFLENALSKALFYSKQLKAPVIADDSGLVIESLKGFPGIFSSRFMEGESYKRKMEKILKMLEGEKNRSAKFICNAVFSDVERGFVISSKGEVTGNIAEGIRGSEGFGYDPIFIPRGFSETFGELKEEIKNSISHRKKAFEKLFSMLRGLI